MKTVGDKLTPFVVTGVNPGQGADPFFNITENAFPGKWKVIVQSVERHYNVIH